PRRRLKHPAELLPLRPRPPAPTRTAADRVALRRRIQRRPAIARGLALVDRVRAQPDPHPLIAGHRTQLRLKPAQVTRDLDDQLVPARPVEPVVDPPRQILDGRPRSRAGSALLFGDPPRE